MKFLALILALVGLFFVRASCAQASLAADLNERVVYLPFTVKQDARHEASRNIILTLYAPAGQGPFPLAVINHGRDAGRSERANPGRVRFEEAARYFVRKGFAVLVPTRLGYGDTGQDLDPEESGACFFKNYQPTLDVAADEVLAAVDYARTLPWVDSRRIVLMGQSVGGIVSAAAAALNPPGVVTAINFAGGAGGDPATHPGIPCDAPQLQQAYADMGRSAHIPMLWVYTRNDLYFGPQVSQAWANAYQAGGAPLDYRLLDPFSGNGHCLFADGGNVWMPLLDDYLTRFGFNRPGVLARPPVSGYAEIEQVEKVPYLSMKARQSGYRYFLDSPAPRAFAINADGHWSAAFGSDAMGRALSECRQVGGVPCELYAVDGEVVWSGAGGGAASH
jgi:dienelactone hydrolase